MNFSIGKPLASIIIIAVMLPMLFIGAIGCGGKTDPNSGGGGGLINQATLVAVVTPSNVTYGTTAVLSTTGGSGAGAVSFSAGSSTGCSTTGTTLTVTNASGTCSVSATKAGDTEYYSATSAPVAVALSKANLPITWAAPAAITFGTPLSATQLNASCPLGTVAYNPTSGTTLAAGNQTLAASCMPTDTADYVSATDQVTLVVNKAVPLLSWPTPAPITSATTLALTLNATAGGVAGSFAYTATLSGGSPVPVTPSSTLAAGSYTLTATFTSTDTNYVSGGTISVPLTVTQAPPTITSLSLTSIYCETAPCGPFNQTITGTGFQVGGTISLGIPGAAFSGQIVSSTQIQITNLYLNPNSMTPGLKPTQYCEPGGACSNTPDLLLTVAGNTTTVDYVNKELYNQDPAMGEGYKFKIDPVTEVLTPDGNFAISTGDRTITYDATTNYVEAAETNGVELYQQNIGSRNVGVLSANIFGVAAYNGEGCGSDPMGMLYCIDMTQYTAPYGQVAVNSPAALAMGPITTGTTTETDVLVVTRDGTPTLNKLYPNGSANPIPGSTFVLPGVTPISSLPANTGGWYEALLNGTSATLASADKLAIFVNASTMQKISTATFASPAYLLVSDTTAGKFIVEIPNLATGAVGFASIDPVTGNKTTLNSTSTLFGGLALSPSGNKLYTCSGSQCTSNPNQ